MCGYDGAGLSEDRILGVDAAVQNLRTLTNNIASSVALPPITKGRGSQVTLKTPLLTHSGGHRHDGCQNESTRNALNYGAYRLKNHPGFATGCSGGMLFATLSQATHWAPLRQCLNSKCKRTAHLLKEAMPACRWGAFNELVLTTLSCPCLDFLEAIYDCVAASLLEGHGRSEEPPYSCVDMLGVIDVLRWATGISRMRSTVPVKRQFFGSLYDSMPPALHIKLASLRKRLDFGVLCPNRLWNLAEVCRLGTADLIPLAAVAQNFGRAPQSMSTEHKSCTEQTCTISSDNSTLVTQAHKCAGADCINESYLSPDMLNEAYLDQVTQEVTLPRSIAGWGLNLEWRQTAWSIASIHNTPSLCEEKDTYMAVSHVWSDGTGVGRKRGGMVNTCLLDFFAYTAGKLNCAGFWWDAVSLPTGREEKRAAVNVMLENYKNASVTLVHDKGLLNCEWRDDGSPAVALVLSAWFSRGWTAAELFASSTHPVKVMYKNPAPRGPPLVVKDLDTDVLAFDNQPSDRPESHTDDAGARPRNTAVSAEHMPKLGYFVASDLIRRFRTRQYQGDQASRLKLLTLEDLLQTLKGRTTSFYRDYLIIAALMCSVHPGDVTTYSDMEITRVILTTYGSIRAKDLYHTEMPMTWPETWSWCPPSVHSLGNFYREDNASDGRCSISGDGRLSGIFLAFPVRKDHKLRAVGSHLALATRVSAACLNLPTCLLLTHGVPEKGEQPLDDRIFILATAVEEDWPGPYPLTRVSCNWVACVRVISSSSEVGFWKTSCLVKAYFGQPQYGRTAVEVMDLGLFSAESILVRIPSAMMMFDNLHSILSTNIEMQAVLGIHGALDGIAVVKTVLTLAERAIREVRVDEASMDDATHVMQRLISNGQSLRRSIEDLVAIESESRRKPAEPSNVSAPDHDNPAHYMIQLLSNLETLSGHLLGPETDVQRSIQTAREKLPTTIKEHTAGPNVVVTGGRTGVVGASRDSLVSTADQVHIGLRPMNEVVLVGQTLRETNQLNTFETNAGIILEWLKREPAHPEPVQYVLQTMLESVKGLVAGEQFAMQDILTGFKHYLLLLVLQSLSLAAGEQGNIDDPLERHPNLVSWAKLDDSGIIPSADEVKELCEQLGYFKDSRIDSSHPRFKSIEEQSWSFEFLAKQTMCFRRLFLLGEGGEVSIGLGPEGTLPGDQFCIALDGGQEHLIVRPTGPKEVMLIGGAYFPQYITGNSVYRTEEEILQAQVRIV